MANERTVAARHADSSVQGFRVKNGAQRARRERGRGVTTRAIVVIGHTSSSVGSAARRERRVAGREA